MNLSMKEQLIIRSLREQMKKAEYHLDICIAMELHEEIQRIEMDGIED